MYLGPKRRFRTLSMHAEKRLSRLFSCRSFLIVNLRKDGRSQGDCFAILPVAVDLLEADGADLWEVVEGDLLVGGTDTLEAIDEVLELPLTTTSWQMVDVTVNRFVMGSQSMVFWVECYPLKVVNRTHRLGF